MEGIIEQLYTFILPLLNQHNINDGISLIFKLTDCIKKLENKVDLYETKNKLLHEENMFLKKCKDENKESFLSLKEDIHQLSNTNIVNMLQMTKHQLEETKEQIKMNKSQQNHGETMEVVNSK
tara:strand:- start:22 stop:390 length:369 start_codon:yes stop_codon:yes gene_type:complete